MGAEVLSWFANADGETIVWMIIAVVIIAGTFLGMLYWDRFLHRMYEEDDTRR